MKSIIKPVVVAALLATAGFAALSHGPAMGERGAMMGAGAPMHEDMRGNHHRMGKMDPAKMQAWMDKRNAELKTQLKLTPAQEGAWTAYVAARTPPADMLAKRTAHRAERAELLKLPLPERIDKMKALRTQRLSEMSAAMDQHGDATKTFYAALTAEQQQVLEANTMPHRGGEGHKGGRHDGQGPGQTKP